MALPKQNPNETSVAANPIPDDSNIKLDARDKSLLSILSVNARIPISELSKKLGLNRDTTNYRINRLHKAGVIERFFAEVDFSAFGFSQFHVFMHLDQREKGKAEQIIAHIKNHPNTVALIVYSDRWDIGWTLVARSPTEFDETYTSVASAYPETILDRSVSLVISQYPTTNLPYDLHKKYGYKLRENAPVASPKIDKHDLVILKCLIEDARAPSTEIATKAGLSADAVISRIKRLYTDGVIAKFTIQPNWAKLGYSLYTLGLRMKSFERSHQKHVETFVHDKHYIVSVLKTIGDWDLVMDILADTPDSYYNTIVEIKSEFSNILKKHETWVAYRRLCFNPMPKVIGEKHT